MTICERWSVAVVPFPFVDAIEAKTRPALVLSSRAFNQENGHTIFAMITRGAGQAWPSDVTLADYRAAGLPAPSLVRRKLFTLDNRLLARVLGSLTPGDRQACAAALKGIMAVGSSIEA